MGHMMALRPTTAQELFSHCDAMSFIACNDLLGFSLVWPLVPTVVMCSPALSVCLVHWSGGPLVARCPATRARPGLCLPDCPYSVYDILGLCSSDCLWDCAHAIVSLPLIAGPLVRWALGGPLVRWDSVFRCLARALP